MKKEIWQDALNETDEKFATEYAKIMAEDARKEEAAKAPASRSKIRKMPKWMGGALIAACLSLALITAAATGAFKRETNPLAGTTAHLATSGTAIATTAGPETTAVAASTTAGYAQTTSQNPAPQGSDNQNEGISDNQPAAAPQDQGMQTEASQSNVMVKDGYTSNTNLNHKNANSGSFAEVTTSRLAPAADSSSYGFYGGGINTEEYSAIQENGYLSVKTSPFATFAADVDTASYANLRRMIQHGQTIPADAVRIEELINYFHYTYTQPREGEPFGVSMELADCPWNEAAKLLLIGLQAKSLDTEALPASNLVFLIDVSGSMASPNKLPLVQRSFMTLAENLSEDDRVTIITYSSGEKLVLDGVSGDQTARIMGALEELEAGGSTNGQQALKMAYETAKKHFIPGGNNRIILATDGDFNVGITSEAELTGFVREEAKDGVYLSVLGYGMGNYKDNKMEAMADNGNGNYYYIDDIAEARKVLVEEAGGTLFTVAKDVKLQVEFNPAQVKGYRLIGYENRVMAAEDFADDTKDGGELGAGHQVTALFEIIPAGSDFEIPEVESRYGQNEDPSHITADEWLVLNIRYKEPDGDTSQLLSYPLALDAYARSGGSMSPAMSWAAGMAQWGMLLRDSEYKGSTTYEALLERLEGLEADGGPGMDDLHKECLELIRKTAE